MYSSYRGRLTWTRRLTPPVENVIATRAENWALVKRRSPVLLSITPPVIDLYFVKALVAMRIRVVPTQN